MNRVKAYVKFKNEPDCVENLSKALFGVDLLRWIVTYPVDKVIRSLNNWGQEDLPAPETTGDWHE